MTSSTEEPAFADLLLNQWLSGMGLGVEYTRAEGNTLYYRDGDGREVPVLDLACGFGSLIFGHNHPEIIAHAKSILDARVPVHAQLSVQSHANRISAALNARIKRETNSDAHYSAVFANSGSEAIEICMKHAELERQDRIAALRTELTAHAEEARRAVREERATVAETPHLPAGAAGASDAERLEHLIGELERGNAAKSGQAPVFLTLQDAFHGKLVGSIQLTQNEQWRTPFTALAARSRFLPVDRPGVLGQTVEDLRDELLDLVVEDGRVRVVGRDFPVVCAFFVEPVRGGAGMKPVTPEFASEIEKVRDALGCPLVVDEVQSGMGRAGALLASSHLGLRGDYYTLAKSIGGGIAKNSVALIRQDRFRHELEVIHSSTFAKDGFSAAIAVKVLEMLEADDGRAYRVVTERGTALHRELDAVRAEFPDVIADVHGLGLMLGVEIRDQSEARSERIGQPAREGVLGYVLAGYLLRRHRIRVLPAGPSWRFIRFSPSLYITDEEIARTGEALRSLCRVLREQDGAALGGE